MSDSHQSWSNNEHNIESSLTQVAKNIMENSTKVIIPIQPESYRVKYVCIGERTLMGLIVDHLIRQKPLYGTDQQQYEYRLTNANLPDDAKFEYINYNPWDKVFRLMFSSSQFDEVDDGASTPCLNDGHNSWQFQLVPKQDTKQKCLHIINDELGKFDVTLCTQEEHIQYSQVGELFNVIRRRIREEST